MFREPIDDSAPLPLLLSESLSSELRLFIPLAPWNALPPVRTPVGGSRDRGWRSWWRPQLHPGLLPACWQQDHRRLRRKSSMLGSVSIMSSDVEAMGWRKPLW